MSKMSIIDSLVANEFELEIDGENVDGIFRVVGLTTYQTDADGNYVQPGFQVYKMVQRDAENAFNSWLRETLDARNSDDTATREICILAIDDGVMTRRWTAKNARIVSVNYSDFDTASSEMIAEIFQIACDDITDEWTA